MDNPADRTELSQMLDKINHEEKAAKRPMLSALVVHAMEKTPGVGLYECARGLGRLKSRDRFEELAFWVDEVKAVYSYWQTASTRRI